MKRKVYGVVLLGLLLGGCAKTTETESQKASSQAPKTAQHSSTTASSTTSRKQASQSSVTKENSSSATNSASDQTSAQPTVYWNQSKAQQLRQFMAQFSQEMNQDYREYSPTHNVNQYGMPLPQGILEDHPQKTMAIRDVPVKIQWSTDGRASAGTYSLVAVYADSETQDKGDEIIRPHHVYFFTLIDGIPKVLLTTQNQDTNDGLLHFGETENVALKQKFAEIIAE
ncbi:hypothetical protein LPAF129_17110 [Ligilactobacillus pabuli]|uniref:DUF4767 domain-containing protein n=1 Tax=Ligilactobacillus pabuli TaxID=2886039 RepID=A0ABQ5JIZ7_9LACO|nr:DUF4767 domain-containing protein [Ligilactobacillus pabuli]GKS82025.1 hypothetical protein LPAF129_17110 [Ligilactobacillus pabuli]